jgi:hypothetical protein
MPLVGPDEPRYAQVAREMFMRGDLITPTLGGRPWFEKPALLYWLIIFAYKLFGVSEFSARCGAALCGLLTVVPVAILARNFEKANSESAGLSWWTTMACATSFRSHCLLTRGDIRHRRDDDTHVGLCLLLSSRTRSQFEEQTPALDRLSTQQSDCRCSQKA